MGNTNFEIGVHIAAALPEVNWLEYSFLSYNHLLETPIEFRDGYALVPDRPGHGLRLADAARSEFGPAFQDHSTAADRELSSVRRLRWAKALTLEIVSPSRMQFYLNGYQPGDPRILPAAPASRIDRPSCPTRSTSSSSAAVPPVWCWPPSCPSSPASRPRSSSAAGPLQVGQADGVACRTVEMFEAFGLSEKLVREAYWVNETVFWRPAPKTASRIVRTGRVQDTEDGLSEFPHVIVNQARLQQFLLEYMRKLADPARADYGLEFAGVEVATPATIRSTSRCATDAERRRARSPSAPSTSSAATARAARSAQSIGAELHGDFANHAWGVMDMLAVTDFPDIRLKAAIQSADEGNILLIPREGGYLVRLYVDLGEVDPDERDAPRERSPPTRSSRSRSACCARTRSTSRRWPGSSSTRSASASPTASTTCRRSRRRRARRACSSPATPATRTAPRPARA